MRPQRRLADPRASIGGDKASEKILVLAAGLAIVERDSNHFVAGARGFIPRAVLGSKDVAVILPSGTGYRNRKSTVAMHCGAARARPAQ